MSTERTGFALNPSPGRSPLQLPANRASSPVSSHRRCARRGTRTKMGRDRIGIGEPGSLDRVVTRNDQAFSSCPCFVCPAEGTNPRPHCARTGRPISCRPKPTTVNAGTLRFFEHLRSESPRMRRVQRVADVTVRPLRGSISPAMSESVSPTPLSRFRRPNTSSEPRRRPIGGRHDPSLHRDPRAWRCREFGPAAGTDDRQAARIRPIRDSWVDVVDPPAAIAAGVSAPRVIRAAARLFRVRRR